MLTKTTLVLAAALVAGTASFAAAQEADPNLLNRYPTYNGAYGVGDSAELVAPRTFQSAQVGLYQGGDVGRARLATGGRPQVQTYRYDSAPLVSGAGN